MRWFLCRVGRHFFVTVNIEGGEADGKHTFCLWCGVHAHE